MRTSCRARRGCGRRPTCRRSPAKSTPLPLVYELGGGGPERARIVCCFLGCDERPYNPLLTRAADRDPPLGGGRARDDRMARHAAEHRGEEVGQRARGRRERPGASVGADVRRGDPPLPRDAPAGRDAAGSRDCAIPVVGQALAALHGERARSVDGRAAARDAWASRVRSSRSDSRRWSASRRCSTSRCGACSSPRGCWSKAATVAAVAGAVGYESEAAFSRAFKKLVGQAPATWRRERRETR